MNHIARSIVLATALTAVAGSAVAQTPNDTAADTAVVVDNDDNEFPWGLLGLLGLAGLLGRKRDTVVRTDDRLPNDPTRR